MPLVVRDRAIGVIAAHDKVGADPRFSDDDLRLAETFATRAAVAVDLSQRVARDALRRVVEAQELERRRLARELHDETGQALTSILLGLQGTVEEADGDEAPRQSAARLRELVVATLQDVRRLAVELRPKALDDFGLVAGARAAGGDLRRADRHRRSTSRRSSATTRLPAEVETALYRIVQEALTNVVKHAAGAQRQHRPHAERRVSVTAVIEDDGRGFDLEPTRRRARARRHARALALLGGRLAGRVGAGPRNDDRGRGADRRDGRSAS